MHALPTAAHSIFCGPLIQIQWWKDKQRTYAPQEYVKLSSPADLFKSPLEKNNHRMTKFWNDKGH
jgi:hypothetical protein